MSTAQNLINAVAAIKLASTEIDDLFSEFANTLTGISTNEGVSFKEADKLDPDANSFMAGWTLDAWRQSFIASEGGRSRKASRRGELSLVADLGHPGWLAERFSKPYLYVLWAPEPDSWIGTIDEEGELIIDAEQFALAGRKVLVWIDDGDEAKKTVQDFELDAKSKSWMFAVPLMTIDSRKKVQDLLVAPVFDFLNNEASGLPPDHPAEDFRFGDSGIEISAS